MMTRVGTMLLLGVLLLDMVASAASTGRFQNPSRYIAERNIFGLKPPVPKPSPPPPPLPKVILTGITTILPRKLALLEVTMPAKPREPAKTQSYILTEGQRDGPVQVLAIDEKTGTVRADVCGTVMTLTFEKNGPRPTSAPVAFRSARVPRPFPFVVRR